MEAVQEAFADLLRRIDSAAAGAGPDWEERAVAVIATLISAWDGDQPLAQLCVLAPLSGEEQTAALGRDAVEHIGALLSDAPGYPALGGAVATGAVGAAWELVRRRLTADPQASLASLYGPVLYLVLTPLVGRQRASERAKQPSPLSQSQRPVASGLRLTQPAEELSELTQRTLAYLLRHPGACRGDVAEALDVRQAGQMSRQLNRLEHAGLATRVRIGRANTWTLTEAGVDAALACAAVANAYRGARR